jgi:hypothetical protein
VANGSRLFDRSILATTPNPPCDARLMRCYPVSTRINHVAKDDEECCQPVEIALIQDRLFLE